MNPGGRGCTVFVGNIDFEVPEEKLIEELSSVGRVVSFRLVTDRATGKSKGYGFCTYESPIIAETAVHKLRITLNNRAVKINYAENDSPAAQAQEAEKLDVEAVVEAIDRMDPESTKEILAHMKRMAVNQPQELKKLLEDNPALLAAVFHIALALNLVAKDTLEDLLMKSFSITKQKTQLLVRILQYHDYEVDQLPEDLRSRAIKIREKLLK